MRIEGDFVFNGPRSEVWEVVRDPDVLASCIPGAQKLTKLNENEYLGVINLKIGPVSGSFEGKVIMSNEVPPESCTLTVEGKGGPGFGKGVGNIHLFDNGDGKTLLKYDGELQIGGKLANVGQRLVDGVSKSMIRQGLEKMDNALQNRIAAKSEGQKPDTVTAVESEAVDPVVDDTSKKSLTSIAEVRMLMYVIPVGIALALIGYFLSR